MWHPSATDLVTRFTWLISADTAETAAAQSKAAAMSWPSGRNLICPHCVFPILDHHSVTLLKHHKQQIHKSLYCRSGLFLFIGTLKSNTFGLIRCPFDLDNVIPLSETLYLGFSSFSFFFPINVLLCHTVSH